MGNPFIAVGTGQEIKPEDVLGEPIKGKKVVVLGDTCDTNEIAVFSQHADYIVHEATMEDSLKSKGQLISERNFLGFKSLKKETEFFRSIA